MKKRCFFITMILILLAGSGVNAMDIKAPYQTFDEQLDNSIHQAVVSVVSISPVKIYNMEYIEYTLKIIEEFSSGCGADSIKAIYKDGYRMEPGHQYLTLSEFYNDYNEIVFELESFYLIDTDGHLQLKSQKNHYSLAVGEYKLSDVREHYSDVKNKKLITHINVEDYLDFALSNCGYVRKGYMFSILEHDSYTKELTAIYENSKRIAEKPSDYNYTSDIIYFTPQNIKGGILKPYIHFSLWINERCYELLVTKDSPGWDKALSFYDNFSGNEYNTHINCPLLIKLVSAVLLILLLCLTCCLIIRKKVKWSRGNGRLDNIKSTHI